MSAVHKVYGKVAKNQGTFDRDFTRTHKSFYSFINRIIAFKAEIIPILENSLRMARNLPPPCPPPNYPPPLPPEGARALGVSKRHSSLVIRDFSLSSSTASPNALANPYEAEVATSEAESITDTHISSTNTEANTDIETNPNSDKSDTDTGGWLASHKQAHRRAIAQYLATTTDKTPSTLHPCASTESTAAVTENRASDKDSAAAKNRDSITRRVGSSGHESPHKATFMERCGKALYKKRSFWKNKEGQKEEANRV
ncbi:hypothetical protein GGR55DRAFT_700275 [Xylaria sp. FL0064]|nr:hypothetical protein GGR55DRAFT_700275 [Xylaria sp. FL0064]